MGLNKDERVTMERVLKGQIYTASEFLKAQTQIFERQQKELQAIKTDIIEAVARLEEKTFFSTLKRMFRVYRKH